MVGGEGGQGRGALLDNHCIILCLFYLQKIRDSEISIGFHLPYLDDLTRTEREG